MKKLDKEKISAFKAQCREVLGRVDHLKTGLIVLPLVALAISSTLILDLMKVNDRLTGLTFFSFILAGLISAFGATKLKKCSRDGVIGILITWLVSFGFMITLVVQLASCIGKQGNLKSVNDLKSLYIYGIFAVVYLVLLVGLLLRFVRTTYGRK